MKRPISIIPLLLLTVFVIAFIIPMRGGTVSRGIRIVAKSGESLYLYKDYHALVVGVGDYTQGWPDLPGAIKDAREVASSLKELGFTVKLVLDPTSSQLKSALNNMAFRLGREKNRALLLYYAGHGETLELADGTELGYIIPTDSPLKSRDPMGFNDKAVSMRDIEDLALKAKSKHFLMLFDSCFSGSLFGLVRAAPVDITEKSARPVRQFITAGEAGEQVPDKSVFKIVFLDGIKGEADLNNDGYVTGSELGMHLQDKVVNYTRGGQHPQYGKINNPKLDKGDFVFRLGKAQVVSPPSTSSGLEPEKQRLAEEQTRIEQERQELEQLKMEIEREKLEAERKRLEAEKEKLAMSKRPPKAELKRTFTNSIDMKLVLIPAGSFMMGSPSDEPERARTEEQHEVTITKPFYLQTTEVTQAQWREIMGNNPSEFKGDDHPVENVSWNDVKDFIRRLNQKEGTNKYHLPTEAQWEYACRAGSTTRFFFGNSATSLGQYAWYRKNSGKRTHPVGGKKPNPWGLYDMHGNVGEWCQDWLGDYPTGHVTDPKGPSSGKYRVVRGGSRGSFDIYCRSATRTSHFGPDDRHGGIGFRLARDF